MRRHLPVAFAFVVGSAVGWVACATGHTDKRAPGATSTDLPAEVTVNLPDPTKEKGSPLVARTVVVHWSFDSFGRKAARERTVQGDDVWVTVKYPDGRGVTYYGTLGP